MSLLIDGYNLLHASGILGRGIGPGSLERSRKALLNFLAESLEEKRLESTTVVFDAHEAPPGLPRVSVYRGITVRFAPRGSDADTEIERLVSEHHAPRRLTVVSGDHRLHRAARRRKARCVDSDKWYADVVRARIERARAGAAGPISKPPPPATEAEVRFWLKQFGLEVPENLPNVASDAATAEPADESDERVEPGAANPFPPGYAEDIREEDV